MYSAFPRAWVSKWTIKLDGNSVMSMRHFWNMQLSCHIAGQHTNSFTLKTLACLLSWPLYSQIISSDTNLVTVDDAFKSACILKASRVCRCRVFKTPFSCYIAPVWIWENAKHNFIASLSIRMTNYIFLWHEWHEPMTLSWKKCSKADNANDDICSVSHASHTVRVRHQVRSGQVRSGTFTK